jgi:hypothetical protein
MHALRSASATILWICLSTNLALLAQSAPQAPDAPTESSASQSTSAPSLARIRGAVTDQSGAVISNVKVVLQQSAVSAQREARSDKDGNFAFPEASPGPFQLKFSASGFAPQDTSAVLHPGEDLLVPTVALAVARADVDVDVTVSQVQVAEEEVKLQEKQRVLGVIPNFYVSYVPDAAPLTPKLKFQLAWKSIIDPVGFVITGGIAGVEQANNSFSGYGQGAEGYAKRYGAAYGDLVTGTIIGGAIFPSLFKQDPRYFYKGTGSTKSRVLYALAMSVMCKGDNKRWQFNYSGILGGLAAGGISDLYYPPENRNGASLAFENTAIGIAGTAAGNILQEFVVRKFTPHLPSKASSNP